MNLVIDIGNSLMKLAVFQNNSIITRESFPRENASKKISEFFELYPEITHGILSNVGKRDEKLEKDISSQCDLMVLGPNLKLPFTNRYATPNSLGKDRIALVAAAVNSYPGRNVLVIDAGTCITYDLKTAAEEYLGGAISPGMRMRFESLHKFTANLPLVSPKPEVKLIGDSTENSILSGIINGLRMELKGQIDAYAEGFEELLVIFTGGDGQFLSIPFKNSIFANSNFLLEGLNFILEFNKAQ